MRHATASAYALVVLSCACGSGHHQTTPPGLEQLQTAVGTLLPSAAANAPSSEEQASCVAAECPEITLFGAPAAGCCVAEQACGGHVQIAERSWLCLPPGYDRSIDGLRSALAAHAGESIVLEASCPSLILDGSLLVGCCITGGTCGVSTEPWTGLVARLDPGLQTACIPASEAARIVGSAAPDAGSARACASPGRGSDGSDAGRAELPSPDGSPEVPGAAAEQL